MLYVFQKKKRIKWKIGKKCAQRERSEKVKKNKTTTHNTKQNDLKRFPFLHFAFSSLQ